jgi:hypothetical protein
MEISPGKASERESTTILRLRGCLRHRKGGRMAMNARPTANTAGTPFLRAMFAAAAVLAGGTDARFACAGSGVNKMRNG